jgi:hypothetical protein
MMNMLSNDVSATPHIKLPSGYHSVAFRPRFSQHLNGLLSQNQLSRLQQYLPLHAL